MIAVVMMDVSDHDHDLVLTPLCDGDMMELGWSTETRGGHVNTMIT